jgi:hypothetical protein
MEEWVNILNMRCREDVWYQQCLKEARAAEDGFRILRNSLTPQQRSLLEAYLMTGEELEHARLRLAYALGCEHGRINRK